MIHLFLANGFEEIEAITVLDVLRRCKLEVEVVSIVGSRLIVGAHGGNVMADDRFQRNRIAEESEGLILPGGMPGAKNLMAHDGLKKAIIAHAAKGTLVAAICAAPMILGEAGVLNGKKATCYPGFEEHLKGAILLKDQVVVDGNIITGRNPGAAFEFALAIAKHFRPNLDEQELRREMGFDA